MGRRPGNSGVHRHPLSFNRVHVDQVGDGVGLRVVHQQEAGIPAAKLQRGIHQGAGRVRRLVCRAQPQPQPSQSGDALLRHFARGDIQVSDDRAAFAAGAARHDGHEKPPRLLRAVAGVFHRELLPRPAQHGLDAGQGLGGGVVVPRGGPPADLAVIGPHGDRRQPVRFVAARKLRPGLIHGDDAA